MAIARRSHLFPYRTQKLSSLALMILGGRLPGKVGRCRLFWSYGQAVKTPPFHGGNPGSIPGRITKQTRFSIWESGFSLMGSFVPVSANMDSGAYLKKLISCACGGIGNVHFVHSSGKAAAVAFVEQIALRLSGQIRSHAACPPTWTPAHT